VDKEDWRNGYVIILDSRTATWILSAEIWEEFFCSFIFLPNRDYLGEFIGRKNAFSRKEKN
jgi:hypothetical protein